MSRRTVCLMDHLENIFVSNLVRHRVHGLDLASGTSVLRVPIQAPVVAMAQIIIRLVSELMRMRWSPGEPCRGAPALRAFSEGLITVPCI